MTGRYSFRETNENWLLQTIEILLALSGICIFACFIHRVGSLFVASICGLLIASLAISYGIYTTGSVIILFGLAGCHRAIIAYTCAGLVLGLIAATGYRLGYNLPLLPGTLTVIALISPLIGMTEELLFRGYLQGRSQLYGPVFSVFIAAAAHTLYKYLVLKSMVVYTVIDFPRLVLFTFLFGLIVGAFRHLSHNVIPALAAHALFDILVYGDFTEMPVWVWG
jgi:membrane protease YdiL (CAAX protease family)